MTLVIASAVAGLAASDAVAQDWTGWYFGAHVGSSRVNTSAPSNGDGANAGVHLGYHYQLESRLVLGAELEFNETDIRLSDGNKVSGLCRAKAIVGFARGKVLPYALAGVGKLRSDDLGDDFGWTAGLGVAYRVSESWAISGEVAYHQHTDVGGNGLNADANSVTVRASYRF